MPQSLASLAYDLRERIASAPFCVVSGNSGSLLDLPPQSEWVQSPSPFFIGVNRILRTGLDGRIYVPDLVIFNDRRVLWSDGDADRLASRFGMKVAVGANVYCRSVPSKHLDNPPPISHDYEFELVQCNRPDPMNLEPIRRQAFPQSIDEPLVHINNITFAAMQIAMLLGFKRILLIGCENAWPRAYMAKTSHFYDKDEIKDPRARPFETGHLWLPYWDRLGNELRTRKISAIDGSPWRNIISNGRTGLRAYDARPILTTGEWPVEN